MREIFLAVVLATVIAMVIVGATGVKAEQEQVEVLCPPAA